MGDGLLGRHVTRCRSAYYDRTSHVPIALSVLFGSSEDELPESAPGPGCVKTPTSNLRVESLSRLR
jgi:hypothetical protein